MTAQLVLQFKTTGDSDSFGRLVSFEEALISVVGRNAEVDGHDFVPGEMNVFIMTDDPIATFDLIQKTGESIWPAREMRAAYRPIDREEYICLWPPEMRTFTLA